MTDILSRPIALPLSEQTPVFRLRAEMNGILEAPGKVWFFDLAAAVIDADRCVQCGACVAACPTDSIGVSDEDIPMLVKMCTGCSLCWDFCPRGGLRYESTWLRDGDIVPAPELKTQAVDGTWKITGADPAPGLGLEIERIAARVKPESKYVARTAQDGGVVTAILLAALEAKEIDGALVAREDPETPWRGIPYIAKSREEIIAAGGTFYNQTMALAGLNLSKSGLPENPRIAVVGTPCEIQGIRALQQSNWRYGDSRIDSITLTIALLCTKSFDYKRLMLDAIADERGIDLADVGKLDVIHGKMIVENKAGETIIDEPIKAFHGAALKGCDECADFLGRAADISVGSVGSDAGYSSVIVRTPVGEKALANVRGELEVIDVAKPEALAALDRLDKKIAFSTLHRDLEPNAPMFIDFADHLNNYDGTDRAPVYLGR